MRIKSILVDVGFGSHLALQPIPFTGEFVTSITGDYRIETENTELGEFIFEIINIKN